MAQTPEHAARVLGLVGTPTLEEVKRVRREMALKYHPDRCAEQEKATRHMARINAAADTLIAYLQTKPETEPQQARRQRRATRARPDASAKHHSTKQTRQNTKRARCPENVVPAEVDSREERPACKAQSILAERAAASYRTVLDRIGKQKLRPSVDIQILQFETSAA